MREKSSVYNANKAMPLSLSCFLHQTQLVARTPWTDVRGGRRAGGLKENGKVMSQHSSELKLVNELIALRIFSQKGTWFKEIPV